MRVLSNLYSLPLISIVAESGASDDPRRTEDQRLIWDTGDDTGEKAAASEVLFGIRDLTPFVLSN